MQEQDGTTTPDPATEAVTGGDWAWRRWLRAHPHARLAYRALVAVAGTAVTVAGLALVPLPGPGWLVVFLGLAILASEFTWARTLLHWGRHRLSSWTRSVSALPWPARAAVAAVGVAALGTAAVAAAGVWGLPAAVVDALPHWAPAFLRD